MLVRQGVENVIATSGPIHTSVMTPKVPSLPRKMRLMSYPADDFFARDRVHITRPSAGNS